MAEKIKRALISIPDRYRRVFLGQIVVYLLAYSSIFRANFNYADDVGRVAHGYHGWMVFSRHTSTFLSNIIHADWYLADVSPLTQILAVIFLSLAGAVLVYLFVEESKTGVISTIAVLLIGLSPYFLGCISYKYDSPYMALSILVSIVPFLFVDKRKWAFEVSSFVCLLIMCTSYQAAAGIYPMISIFLFGKMIHEKKENGKAAGFVARAVLSYIVSLGFYALFLMHSAIAGVSSEGFSVGRIFGCYKMWFGLIKSDFKNSWILLIIALIVLSIAMMSMSSEQGMLRGICLSAIVVVFSGLAVLGVLPVLSREVYNPRYMMSFGVFLSLLALTACNGIKIGENKSFVKVMIALMTKVIVCLLAWCFFVYMFSYGNCLYEQKRYTEYHFQLALDDIMHSEDMMEGNVTKICQRGTIGLSPIIQRVAGNNTLLERTIGYNIPGIGGEGNSWFTLYYGLDNLEEIPKEDIVLPLKTIARARTHTISVSGDVLVIDWNSEE
nr:glucosyltransferase domain-containing protein [uncultured Butyrivibrio sp.]